MLFNNNFNLSYILFLFFTFNYKLIYIFLHHNLYHNEIYIIKYNHYFSRYSKQYVI